MNYKNLIIPFLVFSLQFSNISCSGKDGDADPNAARRKQLAGEIEKLRSEVGDFDAAEFDAQETENTARDLERKWSRFDPRRLADTIVGFQRVEVLQIPEKKEQTLKKGPLTIGFIETRIQGEWNELIGVASGIENTSELGLWRLDITLESISEETTMILVASYPADVEFGESPFSTEEASDLFGDDEEVTELATAEADIESLEKELKELKEEKDRKAAFEKRKEEVDSAIRELDNWSNSREHPSDFLRDLPVRWPIGIPGLKHVSFYNGVLTFTTYGLLDEVSKFLLEFRNELSGIAGPFVLNFNPMIKGLDGRNIESHRSDGEIVYEWKGLPVLELKVAETSSVAFDKDSAFIVVPIDASTPEKSFEGGEWSPSPAKCIRAVRLAGRETAWESDISGEWPVTNIVTDASGSILYGMGKSVFYLSPDTGETIKSVEIPGEAMEMAVGAWGRILVRIRKSDGSEGWVAVGARNE